MENIFESSSDLKTDLRKIYYNLLKTKKGVTYEMVFKSYIELSVKRELEQSGNFSETEYQKKISEKFKEFEKKGYNADNSVYNTMKKIIPNFNKEMIQKGYPVISDNTKNTVFTLVSDCDDPLQQEEKEAEYNKYAKLFADKIQAERPVCVKYRPFNKKEQTIIFHPHVLRKYIDKWYVIGISEVEGHTPKKFDMAINRVKSVTNLNKSIKYIASKPNEYDYLRDIIGIYKEDKNKERIILKATDENTHGKLVANPLHSSQKDIGDNCIELNVIPNGELRAIILSYGSKIIVEEPQSFRDEIQKEIKEMLKCYDQE